MKTHRSAEHRSPARFLIPLIAIGLALAPGAAASPTQTLTVEKKGAGAGIVTSSPAGIECGATCSANFLKSSTVVLTGAPGLHTLPAQWSGCNEVITGDKCAVAMSAAKAVTATFDPQPGFPFYAVSVQRTGAGSGTVTSSPAGISCGGDCQDEYLTDTELTLSAEAAPGSAFKSFSGCASTGPTTCQTTIKAAKTVKANFVLVGTRTLTLALAGTGSGTVKSKAAGIECSASCSPQVAAGKKITLSAKAASGSTFSGWSGACSGTKACKVTMSEAKSVTATFAKAPVPVPGIAAVAARAKVKGGKALLRIRCNGPNSCRGSLKLFAKLKGKGKKATAIGSATFSLAPGASTTLKVTLSPKARQALKHSGKLKARVSGAGIGSPHAVKLKLASK